MSNPLNVLSFFRSYSYHHILILCDGTSTAESLADLSSEISLLDSGARSGERFDPRTVTGGGQYVVLANGTSDARFYVESANWETVFTPGERVGGVPQFAKMQNVGQITIREPLGVEFTNVLARSFSSLGIDPTSGVYLLKTIFVGHTDNGTSETISNIQPYLFQMFDLKVDFSMTGSTYVAEVAGIVNGSAKLPLHNGVADGFSFDIPAGSTLKGAMQKLETDLNQAYQKWKESIKQQAECNKVPIDFENDYRDVTYRIVLNPPYDSDQYKAGTNEEVMKSEKKEDGVITTNLGNHASIENLIENVMRTSKEVIQDDKRDENNVGIRHVFKIQSSLETDAGQNSKYEVVFYVNQYEVATNLVREGEDPFNFEPPDGVGLTFDYIFTGQNVDIIDFEMKMEMGLSFLMSLGTMNSSPSPFQLVSQQNRTILSANSPNSKTNSRLMGNPDPENPNAPSGNDTNNRVKTPLYHGMTVRTSRTRNKRDVGGTQSYDALFARQAALENVGVKLKIHGNPQLMADTIPLPSFLENSNGTSPTIQTESGSVVSPEEQNRTIIPSMLKAPGYIKINVKMPRGVLQTEYPYADQLVPFWYQGWYYLNSIQNAFEDGMFTQELLLFSIINDSGQIELGDENDCDPKATGTSSEMAGSGGSGEPPAEGQKISELDQKRASKANAGSGPQNFGALS